MGKTITELDRIQETSLNDREQRILKYTYIQDSLKYYFKKTAMIVFIGAGIAGGIFTGNKIYNLEQTVKMQEKRIDGLTLLLINGKNISNSQLQNLDYRLNNEIQDRKNQVNGLALIDNVYYVDLIKSIHADVDQMNYLDKYSKFLATQIVKVTSVVNQAKDKTNPSAVPVK